MPRVTAHPATPPGAPLERGLSIRYRFFRAIARLDVEYPWAVLAVCALIAVVSIFYTQQHLEFRTGQEDLVTGSSRDTQNYHRYTNEFPDLDGLIVVVRADPDPARAEQFADALAAKLTPDKANVKSVFYRIDPALFDGRALLYLSLPEIKELSTRLGENRALLARYTAKPSLATFFGIVNDETNRAMTSRMMSGLLGSPSSNTSTDNSLDLGFIDEVLKGMLAQDPAHAPLPWDRLTGAGQQSGVLRDGYLASDNGKYLLMDIAQGDGAPSGPDPVDAIQHALDETRAAFPDVEAGMTGSPALARAEESSTAHDVALASTIAIVANVLLVVIPFGGIVEPMFALAALLVGIAWSFGFTTLFVGHLNLLSAVFTSVLAGIGINFPIHLMARYDEARASGRAMRDGVELSVVNTGAGVVASACIMALAFLMPSFTDFRGIAELGLVSAAGLFLCLISAMFVFPALVAIRDRNRGQRAQVIRLTRREPRLKRLYSRPILIVAGAIGVTIALAAGLPRVRFDQNLLKLQAESSEAVIFENKLLKDSGRSSWFAVSLANDQPEAERRAAAFQKLPEVSDAETISTYIPDDQAAKRAALASLRPTIEGTTVNQLAHPGDAATLLAELKSLRFKLGGARDQDPSGQLAATDSLLAQAITRLEVNPRAFDAYEARMASALSTKLDEFRRNLAPGEVTAANLPHLIHDRYVGRAGTYLVQVYPRGDIWDDAPLARFVTALRTIDPDVTGPPIQTWSIASVMRRGYERAAVFALIAVFLFVFADFRNLRDTALATVPLLFGGAWLLEAMGWLRWDFNLANLFAVPIIIGTGVDNGVNMIYRWREERDKSALILTRSVGKSVTIASLTTIAGFAALISATHRGISSLGWVLSLGVTLILVATVVVLPAIFELIGGRMKTADTGSSTKPKSERRRAASGMLTVCAIAIALGARHAYAGTPEARTASNQLVTQAEAEIRRAGESKPMNSKLMYNAIDLLHRAVRLDPENDGAYVDLGFCYGALRDGPTAVDMYHRAVTLNPSAANYQELADIYLRIGDPEKALEAANAGLQHDHRDAHLYNAKGMALNDLDRYDEAAEAFQTALDYDPNLRTARENLSELNNSSTGRGTITKHSKTN